VSAGVKRNSDLSEATLTLRPLGEFIEECDERNESCAYNVESVRGLSTSKTVIRTVANLDGVSLTGYKVFKPGVFAYVPDTSRRGDKVSYGFNDSSDTYIVSSISTVFKVVSDALSPEFLNLLLRRSEFDRYARFNSWGSAREVFSYEDMTRVEIPVPPLAVQQKVVDVWRGLRKMKEENEALAEPLMQLCRSYLQDCKKKWPMREIGPFIQLVEETNRSGEQLPVVGVNFRKEFMPTAANMDGIDTAKYKLMRRGRFVFSGMQTGRDVCIRIGLWESDVSALISPAYSTFEVKSDSEVLPEYFFLYFKRSEMDRLGWFFSDSSVRSNLDWPRFESITIPIPPIEVQQAVVDVYRCASEAKKIAEEADRLSREICPALVRWAAENFI